MPSKHSLFLSDRVYNKCKETRDLRIWLSNYFQENLVLTSGLFEVIIIKCTTGGESSCRQLLENGKKRDKRKGQDYVRG